MNLNKQFDELFATYSARANEILSTANQSATTAENDPLKYAWAKQEGFEEEYDPNANEVVWSKRPDPNYNVNNLMKVRGSVSPETFAETFPEYQVKTQKLDGLLQDIYQQVLDGKITQQRGEELAYQLMSDTWKEAKKQGKPSGAGAGSSSEKQTISRVMRGQRLVGDKK